MLLRRFAAFTHVIYRSALPILALALGLLAVAILTLRFAEAPQQLTVAVGPPGGADATLMEAAARRLAKDRASVRLHVLSVAGPAEAAKALDTGGADLAVIRSDVAIPGNGATVAVLHSDVAALAAARGSHLERPGELAGKRVAVFPPAKENAALFDALLAEYDVAPASVERLMLPPDEFRRAAAERKIDAVFAIGPLRGPSIGEAVAALAPAKHDPVLVPIDAADGMAARGPAYQKVDLPHGFFPGSPPIPKEDFSTLGVATTLEARDSLPDQTITRLTKRLFEMRRALETEAPIATAIEKPDGDKGSFISVHPGAADYFGDNEKSFMDLYGDWIYIGAMTLSGLGSGLAAMVSATRARARKAALALIDQLIELKEAAHAAPSPSRLCDLGRQIEELSTRGLHFARDHDFDEAGLAALRLAIDEARRAIDHRYSELENRPPLIARAAPAKAPAPVPPSLPRESA